MWFQLINFVMGQKFDNNMGQYKSHLFFTLLLILFNVKYVFFSNEND